MKNRILKTLAYILVGIALITFWSGIAYMLVFFYTANPPVFLFILAAVGFVILLCWAIDYLIDH